MRWLVRSTAGLVVAGAATMALADGSASQAEYEQRELLLACQDRIYGAPPVEAETYMETTYRDGHPMVRVVAGGVVDEVQAREINACALRTLGFDVRTERTGVTRTRGGMTLTEGCYEGAPRMYKGTSYCFD